MKRLILICVLLFATMMFAGHQSIVYASPETIARNLIYSSGLPAEKLGDGTTNSLTKGRDYMNAYREAHNLLYRQGWYKSINQDHIPLLQTLVEALESEGYQADIPEKKIEQVLSKFITHSLDTNAMELGYIDYINYQDDVIRLFESPDSKDKEKAEKLKHDMEAKWQ